MDYVCPNCEHRIVFGDTLPRFCEQCGNQIKIDSFADTTGRQSSSNVDDATVAPSQKPAAAPAPVLAGHQSVGRYNLVRQLGSGGMGVVYEAVEQDTQRRVALKLLSTELVDNDSRERFFREGRLAAKLSNPRTTFIYEAGEDDGRPYIAMELMPGETLQDILDVENAIAFDKAVDYILDVIDGLIAAHKIDVIHRDVKPSNCFVDADGRIKVGDFGLSKSMVTDLSLTRTGTFMGTPLFASPEQVRGAKIDRRTDIYAVGATLFTLIANRPPFVGDAMAVTAQIISDPPPPIKTLVPGVPRDLQRVIDRSLSKNPDDRFQNLGELRKSLAPFATSGASLAQIGRRAAAYMIDYVMITLLINIGAGLVGMFGNLSNQMSGNPELVAERAYSLQYSTSIGGWILLVAYFAIMEGLFGWTIGKKIMGLRVVNNQGESPGPWRAALRSFAIPGAFAIPVIANLLRLVFMVTPENILELNTMTFGWMTGRLSELLPILICVLTMRRLNGLRGIHEFISGTRVIQLAETSRNYLADLPRLQIFDDLRGLPEKLGPYAITGVISGNEKLQVLLGKDIALSRQVMIYRSPIGSLDEYVNTYVNRPGRLRWLQGGEAGEHRWDAYEYVDGFPFAMAADNPKVFTWENTREALFDYASELDAAIETDTVPKHLSLDQFLIDRNGHGKLMDISLPDRSAEIKTTAETDSSQQRACQTLCQAFDLVSEKQILPSSISDVITEFKRRPEESGTLHWLSETLKAGNAKIASLKWDSRLGILALTLGVEWTILTGLLAFTSFLFYSAVGIFPPWKWIAVGSFFATGFFVFGFMYQSSPVFNFMQINIRDKSGAPASRFQCGIRMLFSWLPFAINITLFPVMALVGFDQMEAQRQAVANSPVNDQNLSSASGLGKTDFSKSADKTAATTTAEDEVAIGNANRGPPNQSRKSKVQNAVADSVKDNIFSILVLFFMLLVAGAAGIVGCLVSIISPSRGIQDWLARTRLVPF